jgi:hypothetical protein
MSTTPTPCPICKGQLLTPTEQTEGGRMRIDCSNCGVHALSEEALADLPAHIKAHRRTRPLARAALAHAVRKLATDKLVTTTWIDDVLRTGTLPPALERIDNLVLYLAETFEPGQSVTLSTDALQAVVGAASAEQVRWVVGEAASLRLISGNAELHEQLELGFNVAQRVTLTTEGWHRHSALMKDGAGSRHAFMAMKFSAEMFEVFEKWMKPAVALTGFELRPVAGPHQEAGSIDDRMRVEIRTSRFMVCDLSDANQGAYWEAGFAEGLGRKVIYTCRQDVLNNANPAIKVHFDIAHQLIIGWDPADPAKGMQDLKNSIRATLPAEAKMED